MPDPEKHLRSRRLPAGAIWVALLFLLLCGMIVGNFFILGWEPPVTEPVPVRYEPRPCDAGDIPRALRERLGEGALERLQDLAARRALDHTVAPNPLAGAQAGPVPLGALPAERGPNLPPAMVARICAAAGVDDPVGLGMRMVQRAEQTMRDPEALLASSPWLLGHLREQVLLGATAQLEATAVQLAAAPPTGRRPTLVIRGQARQVSTFVIGHEHASEREAATFDAWADLSEAALDAQRFELSVARGRYLEADDPLSRSVGVERTWVEGWFDWEAWMQAVEDGQAPAERPFFELGRLQALQLMSEASLVELVFLGHGIEVDRESHGDARYQPFAMGPVGIGDEHQEVLSLRSKRQGFTLRYGLTLDARAPFWAASCSNRQGGETRPDQSTAAVAFLLANGHYPDAASLDPFVFGVYRALQAALLEAEGPEAAAEAVKAAVRSQATRLEAPGELRSVLTLGEDLWLLQAGGSETPDLLLIGDPAWRPTVEDALRITLATSSWKALESLPGSDELTKAGPWHPCADGDGCWKALDGLLDQAQRYVAAGLPPADDSTRYQVGGLLGRRWVEPDPDGTHRFLRLALLGDASGEVETMLALEDALREAFDQARARRRIQGWVIEGTPSGEVER